MCRCVPRALGRIVTSCYRPGAGGSGAARPGRRDLVVGLGVDLVELSRVVQALDRWGGRLVGKLMDAEEAARLPTAAADRARALALAVAGKEAASKALGTGWSRGVRWRDVDVLLGPQPAVALRGGAAARARALGSSGRTWARLELRDGLAIGEVRLLS
ncbi:MAG: holo-ACP synthase [Acidobacteria bacterium]|nr:MAG: holo-ACP synthase [Acidobacteriota bacterium]